MNIKLKKPGFFAKVLGYGNYYMINGEPIWDLKDIPYDKSYKYLIPVVLKISKELKDNNNIYDYYSYFKYFDNYSFIENNLDDMYKMVLKYIEYRNSEKNIQ